MKLKLVLVEWEDITTHNGWRPHGEVTEPIRCATVGFLVSKDKKYIRLAPTMSDDGRPCDPWTIPMGTVTKYRVIDKNCRYLQRG